MKPDRLHLAFVCSTCKRLLAGWLDFSKKAQITDSGGFMMFERPICDGCLEIGDKFAADQEAALREEGA